MREDIKALPEGFANYDRSPGLPGCLVSPLHLPEGGIRARVHIELDGSTPRQECWPVRMLCRGEAIDMERQHDATKTRSIAGSGVT